MEEISILCARGRVNPTQDFFECRGLLALNLLGIGNRCLDRIDPNEIIFVGKYVKKIVANNTYWHFASVPRAIIP